MYFLQSSLDLKDFEEDDDIWEELFVVFGLLKKKWYGINQLKKELDDDDDDDEDGDGDDIVDEDVDFDVDGV